MKNWSVVDYSKWYPDPDEDEDISIGGWLRQNVSYDDWHNGLFFHMYFRNPEDALAFKLRFGV